jgi:hypothetical protein
MLLMAQLPRVCQAHSMSTSYSEVTHYDPRDTASRGIIASKAPDVRPYQIYHPETFAMDRIAYVLYIRISWP